MKRFISICLFVLAFIAAQTNNLKITVLSTMVADYDYIGEWGFAALVEVDGNQILFDTCFRFSEGRIAACMRKKNFFI